MTINNSQGQLISFVERIEKLNEEKKEILAYIAEVKTSAKSAGFDVKVINQMIKERAMTDADRQEWNTLCELYRATLGMLDGSPMSDNARRRFDPPAEPEDSAPDDSGDDDLDPPADDTPPDPSADDARRDGASAFADGKRVTDNPYPFGSKLRAAWDEGFCMSAGHDGMEIPAAWRRSKPKKEDDSAKGDEHE